MRYVDAKIDTDLFFELSSAFARGDKELVDKRLSGYASTRASKQSTMYESVVERLMYEALKGGDYAAYKTLVGYGFSPDITDVEWAASADTEGKAMIMSDVIERFPHLPFYSRDFLTLKLHSKGGTVESWTRLFELCKDNKEFIKNSVEVLITSVIYAVKKGNTALLRYILSNVVSEYASVEAVVREPDLLRILNRSKSRSSLKMLVEFGMPLEGIEADRFFKKSHKKSYYIEMASSGNDELKLETMYMMAKNGKGKWLVELIDKLCIRPHLSSSSKLKHVMNAYLKEKGLKPIQAMSECEKDKELLALIMTTVG